MKHRLGITVGLLLVLAKSFPCPTDSHVIAAPSAEVDAGSPPKFALLVGITDYDGKYISRLRGCLNDVKAMKMVLVDDFGFKDDDQHIKVLVNKDATTAGIVQAFRQHLVANARKYHNATILFYFSGHGSTAYDANGDEPDGVDETLVTFDSTRDPKDKTHFDLSDDRLDILYKELRPHTNNITFIFDSCHSGTASRAPAGADVQIKEAPPDTRAQPQVEGLVADPKSNIATSTATSSATTRAAATEQVAVAPRNADFVALAGCLPTEYSIDARFGSTHHGALTFYLVQAMKEATRSTTASQIWEAVARNVSSRYPTQHPQIEGSSHVKFLGGATRLVAPAIPYRIEGDKMIIERGVLNGARPGGFVGIYGALSSAKDTALDIPADNARASLGELKARLRIESAEPFKAIAGINPALGLPATGTVELLTPYFGAEPLKVKLDLPANDPIAAKMRQRFKAPSDLLVKIVGDEETTPHLTVTRGPYGQAFSADLRADAISGGKAPIIMSDKGAAKAIPVGDKGDSKRPVYYAQEAAGARPVFDFFIEANGDAMKLCDTLENYAAQRNLLTLSNAASDLHEKISATVYKIDGVWDAGKRAFKPVKETALEPAKEYSFDQEQRFRIEVSNKSDKTLYVAIAELAPDGGIDFLLDANNAKQYVLNPQGKDGDTKSSDRYVTSAPRGVSTFKVLVTTQPTDFSYLERDAVKRSGVKDGESVGPFDILAASALGIPRASKRDATPDFDSWATLDVNFHVSDEVVKLR